MKEWNHIDIFAYNCKITGSIQKICNVHASGDTTLEDYTTGTFKSSTVDINAAPNITTLSGSANTNDIVIQHGECIDGPFIAVHLKSDNTTAIYNNGIDNVVDPDG